MIYRPLGRSGIKVSPLPRSNDVWQPGKLRRPTNVPASFNKALDAGINFVDTADPVQQRPIGKRLSVQPLKGRRDNVVIGTEVMRANGQ